MLLSIKNTLSDCDFEQLWLDQGAVPTTIAKKVKFKLIEKYKDSWWQLVYESSKCLNYHRIFKHELKLENYFNILPSDLSTALCHFRCLNHKLPIEWGRFWEVERDDRTCDLCFLNKLGDEFHYIFECTYFEDQRRLYIPKDLSKSQNILKFETLMKTDDVHTLFKLGKFCKILLNTFKEIFKWI